MLSACRGGDGLIRLNDPQRLDEAAEFDELSDRGRHDPLSGGAADRAIIVMIGNGSDQGKSVVGHGMLVLTMFVVIVNMLADFAGRIAMCQVVMHMAVQQIAGRTGRQIGDRQQADCQAISKNVQHREQRMPCETDRPAPTLLGTPRHRQWNCRRQGRARANVGAGIRAKFFPLGLAGAVRVKRRMRLTLMVRLVPTNNVQRIEECQLALG